MAEGVPGRVRRHPAARTVLVPPARLDGWVERFGRRHGEPTATRDEHMVTLTAPDGAEASYDPTPGPERFGLVLTRRGGYAVGLVDGDRLVASKCGTRYVQGRTKAGGQSQQRYARRRGNQASALVRDCTAACDRVLAGTSGLVTFRGGDRELVGQVLAAIRVDLAPADRWLDVREPRHAVLEEAVGQARAVPVHLNALA